jgi:hypothetical protein
MSAELFFKLFFGAWAIAVIGMLAHLVYSLWRVGKELDKEFGNAKWRFVPSHDDANGKAVPDYWENDAGKRVDSKPIE